MRTRQFAVAALVTVTLSTISVQAQETHQEPHHHGTAVTAETPRFKFAVVTDRHGARPRGSTILEEAVSEINLIDPDFTISIGDLIDGYRDDPEEIRRQWDEFDTDIRKLKRPFYYVFGNHDASNPMMVDLLRKRYGDPYYSFNYKGCHFIVLFTESCDDEGKFIGLNRDAKQIAWLRKDLAANPGAVHTFVFYHRPWASPEIMELFRGRATTVFTGHLHRYEQFEKDGINYHVLGSTGGGSSRDIYSGGLYHYVLVTVSGRTVTPAIVRVGAVLPDTFLNTERLKRIAKARAALRRPTLRLPRGVTRIDQTLEITVDNPLPTPTQGTCTWTIPPGSSWSVTPGETTFSIAPESQEVLSFKVAAEGDVSALEESLLPQVKVKALGGRALNAHSPTAAGLDTLYDITTRLSLDRWPYEADLAVLREPLAIRRTPLTGALTKTLVLTVRNPFDQDLHTELSWRVRNPNWNVTPRDVSLVTKKGGSKSATFVLVFSGKRDSVFPVPRLRARARSGGEQVLEETVPLPVDARAILRHTTPTLACPALTARPVLDGNPNEPAWQAASTVGTFILAEGSTEPLQPTLARSGHTSEGLWLGFECSEPARKQVRAEVTQRDGPVWMDDSCEIFLDTNCDRKTYVQFIFNTIGTRYDGRETDKSWNGKWQVKTGWTEEAWTAEVFIPWDTLGGKPARGAKWGVNLLRKRTIDPDEYSMWSPTLGSAHAPGRFGTLVFE